MLSGVSSFPVLTAAVARRLSAGMARIDTIWGGIAPSPYAGVGANVIRAISGYAGQRIVLRRDGRTATGIPSPSRCATPSPRRARCLCEHAVLAGRRPRPRRAGAAVAGGKDGLDGRRPGA